MLFHKSKNHAGWELQTLTPQGWKNCQIEADDSPKIYGTPPLLKLEGLKKSGDGKEYRIYESLHKPL